MGEVVEILGQNILPIFLVAGMGFVLRKQLGLDKKSLSSVAFYALSPSLVFSSLVNSEIEAGELLQLATFTVGVILLMGGVGLLFSRLLRLARPETAGLLLVVMFVNGGNYGLTLNSLRFGEAGLARAVVYYVVSTIMFFTLGIFVSSMGQTNWRASLKQLSRLPAVYAVVLAVVFYSQSWLLPAPLMRGIEVAGTGAIPVMLVVLGMQIADLDGTERIWLAIPASVLRLAVAPFLAVLAAGLLGLEGLGRSTMILEASMPTAVLVTIAATEFDVQPALVTSAVVVSTVLSMITLPLLIVWLGL